MLVIRYIKVSNELICLFTI